MRSTITDYAKLNKSFQKCFQALENGAEHGGLGEARPTQKFQPLEIHPGDPVIPSKISIPLGARGGL
jgi:hypothetical protein